jgi:uncharacterized protein (TIGR01732 family)
MTNLHRNPYSISVLNKWRCSNMSWGLGWGGPGWCGYGYTAPVAAPAYGVGNTFTLIVVLFILLIIVGAAWC